MPEQDHRAGARSALRLRRLARTASHAAPAFHVRESSTTLSPPAAMGTPRAASSSAKALRAGADTSTGVVVHDHEVDRPGAERSWPRSRRSDAWTAHGHDSDGLEHGVVQPAGTAAWPRAGTAAPATRRAAARRGPRRRLRSSAATTDSRRWDRAGGRSRPGRAHGTHHFSALLQRALHESASVTTSPSNASSRRAVVKNGREWVAATPDDRAREQRARSYAGDARADRPPVRQQVGLERLTRRRDHRQLGVRIGRGAPVAGEVLGAASTPAVWQAEIQTAPARPTPPGLRRRHGSGRSVGRLDSRSRTGANAQMPTSRASRAVIVAVSATAPSERGHGQGRRKRREPATCCPPRARGRMR